MPVVPVTIPSVGESITEGILARWLKADGSPVQAGEDLFELETDKASSNVPAASSGVLHIKVAEGETVAVGATVATIDPSGSTAAARPPAEGQAAAAKKPAAAPEKQQPANSDQSVAAQQAGKPALKPKDDPRVPPDASSAGEPMRGAAGGPALSASPPLSPAARRVVAEHEVDVAHVPATGPGGRVTKGDVLAYLESGPDSGAGPRDELPATSAASAAIAPDGPVTAGADGEAAPRETRQRMSGLRQRIAQRLVEVQQTAAILTTFNEADLTRVMALRAQYKESFSKKHGVSLGLMSFFVKASVEGLKAYPVINARIEGTDIVFQNFHDIGVAVSTERGLVVPVVRNAAQLSFAAIEKMIADSAAKAKARTLSVADLQGGTFTITNGGTFGSLLSTPIVNPPQSAILGMHAIKKRPVVVDDQIVIRPMMYLALSYDHRLIDGRDAVSFLVHVRDCIENPERMLFEL
jgi:2-oxoglutarate dehydrogenase E2 component (dihydrolipoamide succinyltransferase)